GGGGASARVLVCSGGGPPRAGVGGAGPGGRGGPPRRPPARSTWLRGDPSRVLSAARNGGFQFRAIGACRGSAYLTVPPTGSNQRDANRRALMTTSIKLNTLRHVIEAHGGLKNWNQRKVLSVDLVVGGMLWGLKGQFGKLERTTVTVGLGEEWASHQPFGPDNRRTRFSPDRVAIEDAQGKVLEELTAP